ncbi:MAG TPA: hypothetical protein VEW69_02745 [Alphaproteobacteria bacterium]|nr:hypothetical protein [Alphaproteobacteria bacterium]
MSADEPQAQSEEVFSETVLTPEERCATLWSQQSGTLSFFRQRNFVRQTPELLQYAGGQALKGWAGPRRFALLGLAVPAIILSLLNWSMTRRSGVQEEKIATLHVELQEEEKRLDEIIRATEAEVKTVKTSPKTSFKLGSSEKPLNREAALEQLNRLLADMRKPDQEFRRRIAAQETELRAEQGASALARSATPLMFSLALVFAAGMLQEGVRKDFRRSRLAGSASEFYLYAVTSEGLLANLAIVTFLHLGLSGRDYGLQGLLDALGPVFWLVFLAISYAATGWLLVQVSRPLYSALEIPRPKNEFDFGNRVLVRLHNSFWAVFVGLEFMALLLSYGYYILARRMG